MGGHKKRRNDLTMAQKRTSSTSKAGTNANNNRNNAPSIPQKPKHLHNMSSHRPLATTSRTPSPPRLATSASATTTSSTPRPTIIGSRRQSAIPTTIASSISSQQGLTQRLRHAKSSTLDQHAQQRQQQQRQQREQPILRKSTSSRFGKNLLHTWLGRGNNNGNNSNNCVTMAGGVIIHAALPVSSPTSNPTTDNIDSNNNNTTNSSIPVKDIAVLNTTFESLLARVFLQIKKQLFYCTFFLYR